MLSPQEGPSPGQAGRREGSEGSRPVAVSSRRPVATGRGTGGGGDGGGSRALLVRVLGPARGSVASSQGSARPLLLSGSSGLAPPSHVPNSQGQLVTRFRSPGLRSVPPTLSPLLLLSISAFDGFSGKRSPDLLLSCPFSLALSRSHSLSLSLLHTHTHTHTHTVSPLSAGHLGAFPPRLWPSRGRKAHSWNRRAVIRRRPSKGAGETGGSPARADAEEGGARANPPPGSCPLPSHPLVGARGTEDARVPSRLQRRRRRRPRPRHCGQRPHGGGGRRPTADEPLAPASSPASLGSGAPQAPGPCSL